MSRYLYLKMLSLKDISILIASNCVYERQRRYNYKNTASYLIFHTTNTTRLKLKYLSN